MLLLVLVGIFSLQMYHQLFGHKDKRYVRSVLENVLKGKCDGKAFFCFLRASVIYLYV